MVKEVKAWGGRAIRVTMELEGQELVLHAVYGPAQALGRQVWWQQWKAEMLHSPGTRTILCGDLNVILDEGDKSSGSTNHARCKTISALIKRGTLVDLGKALLPGAALCTFHTVRYRAPGLPILLLH